MIFSKYFFRCQKSGFQEYRVQIFHNEKVTDICPSSGCTWAEFEKKFQNFTKANMDFCSLNYPEPPEAKRQKIDANVPDSAIAVKGTLYLLLLQVIGLSR